MIPEISTIVEDLLAGTITKSQAIAWLNMHAEGAVNERRHAAAMFALQGFLANPKWGERCAESMNCKEQATARSIAQFSYQLADHMIATGKSA